MKTNYLLTLLIACLLTCFNTQAQNTEDFEALTIGVNTFTNAGLSFETGSTDFSVNTLPGAGAGAGGSQNYLDNNDNFGTNQTNSISTTGGELFTMQSIELYLSSEADADPPTDDGTVTITGKASGTSIFTFTQTTGFPTSLGANQGFFLVDFSAPPGGGGDVSNLNIDTLEITINGAFQYIAVDNFIFGISAPTTNVPDDNFENYLETHNATGVVVPLGDSTSMGNGVMDDLVPTAKIDTVIFLDINAQGIADLTGIEDFIGLQTLYCGNNTLTTADFSQNNALANLVVYNNQFTVLDISANTNLTYLDMGLNQITSLTLNTNLEKLLCFANQLTVLDLSGLSNLTELRAYGNPLETLNIANGNNTNIIDLLLFSNPNLTCVKVDNQTIADDWNTNTNTPASFNVDAQTSFSITCDTFVPDDNFENYLETHNASGTVVPLGDPTSMGNGIANDDFVLTSRIDTVTSLDVAFSNIADLTGIEDFTSLTALDCGDNNLTELNLPATTNLISLVYRDNAIANVDFTDYPNLQVLNCQGNGLTVIDVSQNANLQELVCNFNQLTTLDVSQNANLNMLICASNQLSFLNIANGNNPNFEVLIINNNPSLTCVTVDNQTIANNWNSNTNTPDLILVGSQTSFSAKCDTFVPDDNFENYLETHNAAGATVALGDPTSMGNGIANDDFVFTSRIDNVTFLNINALAIADLTGIEDFIALSTLLAGNNMLTSIDVSQNTALTFLVVFNNQLTSLDVSANTLLSILDFGANAISSIDLSTNLDLTKLFCSQTLFTDLDVSALPVLTALWIDNSPNLTALNIANGNNSNFTELRIQGNPNLTCITVDDQSIADDWNAGNNLPATVYTSDSQQNFSTKCDTFVPDDIFENYLETHNAAGATVALGDPTSMGNGIANDDFVFTNRIETVTSLNVAFKNIADLTGIEDFTSLTALDCGFNNLTQLNLPASTNLISLKYGVNAITNVTFADYPNLEVLHCQSNGLTVIDVSQNVNLENFRCDSNQLTTLDVSQNTVLNSLDCYSNQLTTLDVSQNANLNFLFCDVNQLTTLDVSQNTVLNSLNCSSNQLTTLDVSQNDILAELSCRSNQLSFLNIANGNNAFFNIVDIDNNPSLTCVTVDNQTIADDWNSNTNTPPTLFFVDPQTSFSPNCNQTVVQPIVYLQGPYGSSSLSDQLRASGLIPTTSPYIDALTCDASVFTVTGTDAIVDWVWMEIRDVDGTTVLDSTSALIQSDGDVVGTDGTSPVVIDVPDGNYYIMLSHRNHLGVLTASTVSLSKGSTATLDLTSDSALITGGVNGIADLGDGNFALFAGDFNGDGQVQNSDKSAAQALIGISGMSDADLNMNGQVQNTDIQNNLNPNIGKGEQFSSRGTDKKLYAKRRDNN